MGKGGRERERRRRPAPRAAVAGPFGYSPLPAPPAAVTWRPPGLLRTPRFGVCHGRRVLFEPPRSPSRVLSEPLRSPSPVRVPSEPPPHRPATAVTAVPSELPQRSGHAPAPPRPALPRESRAGPRAPAPPLGGATAAEGVRERPWRELRQHRPAPGQRRKSGWRAAEGSREGREGREGKRRRHGVNDWPGGQPSPDVSEPRASPPDGSSEENSSCLGLVCGVM